MEPFDLLTNQTAAAEKPATFVAVPRSVVSREHSTRMIKEVDMEHAARGPR